MAEGVMVAAALIAAGAGTYNVAQSAHAAKQQKRMAEEQQNIATIQQNEQKKEALAKRKELIDQQREGLIQGYRTSTRDEAPKSSGLVGKLEKDMLG